MEFNPIVSVLMTVYNREKYLREGIESVLNSSFSDFELIIVNDCSTDGSLNIALDYEKLDKRIRVFSNEVNLGDYPNRNKAAGYARGRYIKYLDADDVLYPWALEVLVTLMDSHPQADYGLDSMEPDKQAPFPLLLSPYESYFRNYFIAPVFHRAPSSCIIRRVVFESNNGFSGRRFVGDFEMWTKLSRRYNVLLMPQGMVWCRTHPDQESQMNRDSSLVLFQYSVIELNNLNHPDCPLTEDFRRTIIRRIRRYQARSAMRSLFVELNFSDFLAKLELSGLSIFRAFIISFRRYE